MHRCTASDNDDTYDTTQRPRQEADAHRSRVYTETLLTRAIETCTMMGTTAREMSIAQLSEADKYDEMRNEGHKQLADTRQAADGDVCCSACAQKIGM